MKPSIPQGTRDLDAKTVRKRKFILDTIRKVFEVYGFEPLETPAFENIDTLMGKYGEEGDKLIFKILNNGLENENKHESARSGFSELLSGKTSKTLTERALKYDLTIPFARYVAMHHQQLTMPYKRYQVQNVWRADRPQKGRYREFTQCDADVVGTRSIMAEVEFANIYKQVFAKLNLPVHIRVNSRHILLALAQACNLKDPAMISIAIDKLDKIGLEAVLEELKKKGLQEEKIELIENYLNISGTLPAKFSALQSLIKNDHLITGLAELSTFFEFHEPFESLQQVNLDLTLARGLDYYTGMIFEVTIPGVKIGSVGGGGRYDNLTGLFGVEGIPGSGISFGVDRIYDAMEELSLFPEQIQQTSKALFLNLGEPESKTVFHLVLQLRNADIPCEIFYESVKLEKQFKYATKKNIPFAIIIGSREMESKTAVIKELATGDQSNVPFAQLEEFLTLRE